MTPETEKELAQLAAALGPLVADALLGASTDAFVRDGRAAVLAIVGSHLVQAHEAVILADLEAIGGKLAGLGAWLASRPPGPPGDPEIGGNARAEHPPILLEQTPQTEPSP